MSHLKALKKKMLFAHGKNRDKWSFCLHLGHEDMSDNSLELKVA